MSDLVRRCTRSAGAFQFDLPMKPIDAAHVSRALHFARRNA